MHLGLHMGLARRGGSAAVYGPELLPNTEFNDATGVTLSGGASVAGGNLDTGTAQFALGRETFTYTYSAGQVLAMNIVLTRAGDCNLSAALGYSGGSQYGLYSVTASGEYLFTTTEPGTAVPLELTIYNGIAGATSPQIASVSLKLKS